MGSSKKHADNNNNHNHQCNDNHNNNNGGGGGKKARQQVQQVQRVEPEITRLDYTIAKYMRNKLPNKEAMFLGIRRVNFFVGSKAVDLLMESKWATQKEPIFKTRNDASIFLHDLLIKKFFHRAKKIVKMDGAKRKFKLDMHDEQIFQDSNQPYVWLYEPTSITAWLLCLGVIFGVIAVCLFPLWPPILRAGIWYLCMTGLAFLSILMGLAVLRHIIFVTLWALTFGKLNFWILPNLTEDVGFLESFWPLYCIEGAEGGGGGGDADGGRSTADAAVGATSGGDSVGGHQHQE